jgi:carbonic anhydrase
MSDLHHLFEKNRAWADGVKEREPYFFKDLAQQQSPEYLWIGCSDSRVPANQITGLMPGEVFVHRNIANVVEHTDFNCLSVIEFAVSVLKVKHIMVVGHYGCSGVRAAMDNRKIGLATNWLRHVQDVQQKHAPQLEAIPDPVRRADRLSELNTIEQVLNLSQTTLVRDAWEKGQSLTVHAWVYGIGDGLLRDLKVTASGEGEVMEKYRAAVG